METRRSFSRPKRIEAHTLAEAYVLSRAAREGVDITQRYTGQEIFTDKIEEAIIAHTVKEFIKASRRVQRGTLDPGFKVPFLTTVAPKQIPAAALDRACDIIGIQEARALATLTNRRIHTYGFFLQDRRHQICGFLKNG